MQLNASQGVELALGNAVWVAKDLTLAETFIAQAHELNSEARNLDFAADPEHARETINGWIKQNTNSKITNLIPSGYILGSLVHIFC